MVLSSGPELSSKKNLAPIILLLQRTPPVADPSFHLASSGNIILSRRQLQDADGDPFAVVGVAQDIAAIYSEVEELEVYELCRAYRGSLVHVRGATAPLQDLHIHEGFFESLI